MLNNGKEIAHGFGMIGMVEVIIEGFVGEGLSNNACKKHL